jgi:hypothetical protein
MIPLAMFAGNQHSGKYRLRLTFFVIPAKAGIQLSQPF